MIIKSMSRKEPSFDQLANYLSSEKSDPHYDLYHNCFVRSPEDIADEFSENSKLLFRRKNGNYLYHEIISISVDSESDQKMLRDALREIVLRYIEERSAHNLVFGCLHEDHAHNLHYHLMISANERGERKRTRLSKTQFDSIKRELEAHVLKHYPELKQRELIGANSSSEKMSVKAGEMDRRTGKLPEREEVKELLQEAISQTSSMDNFIFFLSERGYAFYTHGKNFGVQLTHENGKNRKYRFSTLGVHEAFEGFQKGVRTEQKDEAFTQTEEAQSETDDAQLKQDQGSEKNEAIVAPSQQEEILGENVLNKKIENEEKSILKNELKRRREASKKNEGEDDQSL